MTLKICYRWFRSSIDGSTPPTCHHASERIVLPDHLLGSNPLIVPEF